MSAWAFSLLSVLCSSGQPTFSHRHHQGGDATAVGIFETHDGYVCFGAGNASEVDRTDLLFWKMDANGEIVQELSIGNDSVNYLPRRASAQFSDGSIVAGARVTMPDTSWIELFWVDPDLNLTHTQSFVSPVYDEGDPNSSSYVELYGLEVTENGLIYVILGTFEPEIDEDYVVLQLSDTGEVVWSYKRNYESQTRVIGSAVWADSLVLSTTETFNDDFVLIIDSSGEVVLEYAVNHFAGSSNNPSSFLPKSQSIVCGARSFVQEPELIGIPLLYEMSYEGEIFWSTAVGNDYGADQRMAGLIAHCDGYIGFSQKNVGVSPDVNWNNTLGWVMRFDAGGQLAWERKYGFAETSAYANEFTDIIATSDGGVLLCGYSYNYQNVAVPDQQAWFLKVDACGCLVPGCDPSCAIPCAPWSDIGKGEYFLYGPNPVSDVLNLYVNREAAALTRPEFVLRDHLGRVVDYFVPNATDITYLWPLDLQSGGYVLTLEDNGVPMQTQQIVIQ